MSESQIVTVISELLVAGRFPPLLNEQQVAEMTGFSVSWLRERRTMGDGPPYLNVPPRSVRYDRDATLAWFRQFAVSRP